MNRFQELANVKTLEQNVKDFCEELKVPEPVEFLAQVMAGHDPRRLSAIYEMVLALEQQYGESLPDEWDYLELIFKIKERYQFAPVVLNESFTAARQLLEYTHAKKKQVEHSGSVLDADAISPLTDEEVELFMEKFNEYF